MLRLNRNAFIGLQSPVAITRNNSLAPPAIMHETGLGLDILLFLQAQRRLIIKIYLPICASSSLRGRVTDDIMFSGHAPWVGISEFGHGPVLPNYPLEVAE